MPPSLSFSSLLFHSFLLSCVLCYCFLFSPSCFLFLPTFSFLLFRLLSSYYFFNSQFFCSFVFRLPLAPSFLFLTVFFLIHSLFLCALSLISLSFLPFLSFLLLLFPLLSYLIFPSRPSTPFRNKSMCHPSASIRHI
jgi:hypothetical protein